jgi:hypothetical protein
VSDEVCNVLVFRTGNSARSILTLPLRSFAGLSLQREIDQIGRSGA